MGVTIILIISILLQFTAAVLALRLIWVTGRRAAWVLIAAALCLMAVRRCITLFQAGFEGLASATSLSAELVALVISVIMLAGVIWITPLFKSLKRSEETLREARDELEVRVQERTLNLTEANQRLEQEIAERRKAEDQISHLASFPELNPSPVLELDAAGKVKYLNPTTRTLFPDLTSQGSRHPFLADWESLLRELKGKQPPITIRDVRVGEAWYEQSCALIPATGDVRIYARDITGRKKLEQLKDEFIGMVSHELRTPLTVINGCISTVLTERDRLPASEVQQLLHDAVLECESLSWLVENLLELSRFQAQQLTLYAEPTDVKTLARETIARVKRQAPAHQFINAIPVSSASCTTCWRTPPSILRRGPR